MSCIINYDSSYNKELYKLYCTARNIPVLTNSDCFIDNYLPKNNGIKIKLLRVNNRIRGYICFSPSHDTADKDRVIIDDIYISKNYNSVSNYFKLIESTKKISLFNHFKYAQLYLNNKMKNINEIVYLLDLSLERKLYEMKMKLDSDRDINCPSCIEFTLFRKGIDEAKRVDIQNSIFKNTKGHKDCSIDDIKFEEEQDYYLEDGCIFLSCNKETAGYSQVIIEKYPYEHPCIVNFGINKKFRGLGLSKLLLNYTFNTIRHKGFNEVFITVDANNYRAYNLYRKAGFNRINTFFSYLYKYKI